MKRLTVCLIAAGMMGLAVPAWAEEGDWVCWRGPAGDGKVKATGMVTDWSGGLKRLWEVKGLTSSGDRKSFAQPSIKGERLVIPGHFVDATQKDKEGRNMPATGRDVFWCLNADTGKEIWKVEYPVKYFGAFNQAGTGPHGTPYIDGDRVYTYGAYGQVSCWALADGKQIWQKNVLEEGGERPFYGFTTSPLVVAGKVIVQGGGKALVIAFDKATGALAWKTGEGQASYGGPIVATFGGRPHVLTLSAAELLALDPETGQKHWSVPFATRGGHNHSTPAVEGDLIFLTAAYGQGCKVVRVTPEGPKEVWKSKVIAARWPDPVVVDGHVYCAHEISSPEGNLKCVEMATGVEKWAAAEFGKTGTLTCVNDLLLVKHGPKCSLLKVSPKGFQKMGEVELWSGPKGSYTNAVIARGKMYVRFYDRLTCFDLKTPAGPTTKPAGE